MLVYFTAILLYLIGGVLAEITDKKYKSILYSLFSIAASIILIIFAIQNILYKKLTNSSKFDSVATYQRDFILGRNAWGVSFIYKFGKNYTKNFHHQISYAKGKLPGGFAAGPATKEFVDKLKIPYEKSDNYLRFQTKDDYYRDDRMDYVTNEPTITGNATAIFVFGNLSTKK